MPLLRATCLLALLLALFAPGARAQPSGVETRRVEARWSKGAPAISYSITEFGDRKVRRGLNSGLPQTIITRLYAYSEKGDPVALSVRSCRVVYDLWEDLYRVQVQTERGSTTRTVNSVEAILHACVNTDRYPLGIAADYRKQRGSRIYFAVIIELNPLSERTLERIRRWLARPGGSGQLSNEALFGSFVSVFVGRRIGSAERIFRFRSHLIVVP